jgi:hypothetical protein
MMKRFISHLTMNITLVSFAIGQSPTAQQPANNASEQEVRQMIEKYRTAILQRDIATLEKISAASSKISLQCRNGSETRWLSGLYQAEGVGG